MHTWVRRRRWLPGACLEEALASMRSATLSLSAPILVMSARSAPRRRAIASTGLSASSSAYAPARTEFRTANSTDRPVKGVFL